MAAQTVFKRYEMKYMISIDQKYKLMEAMKPYMQLDQYGRTIIRNLYFDTDTYLLVRRSIEKPSYKEKIRIRSYGRADADSTVFVELKRKYKHVVYKRRIALTEKEAMGWLCKDDTCRKHTQISEEIDYFLNFYETLQPVIFLSYDREAFLANDGSDFRITFDDTILCRQNDMSLESEVYGTPLLPEEMVLMEIKCSGGIPLWMAHILSKEGIYKTSFSKYGTAYRTMIFPQLQHAHVYNIKEVPFNA